MAKRQSFDATQTLDDATEAAETGIATVTALRREIGVPVREIPLGEIVDNPDNPRSSYDEAELDELAASIAEVGVLQPIVVRGLTPAERRAHPGARFLSIAGHRRRRAAAKAHLDTVPAVERAGEAATATGDLVLMLTENMQRQDLKPLDEARSFKVLSDSGMTQTQISKALGISQAKISKRIALLELEPSVQAALAAGRIAAESAQEFRDVDAEVQRRVAEMLQQQLGDHAAAADGADGAVPAVATSTIGEVRDYVTRAKHQIAVDAKRRKQEEIAKAVGARILTEKSKYADWRRQLHDPSPKKLEKLAAAGHLGAQLVTWSEQPHYYDTTPELLTKQRDAEHRARAAGEAKREREAQLQGHIEQAVATWARQFTASPSDVAGLLAAAVLEQNGRSLQTVYGWLHPDAEDVDGDTVGRWMDETKPGDRPRLALLALAAEDLEYARFNPEKRQRTRDRIQGFAPDLADQLDPEPK